MGFVGVISENIFSSIIFQFCTVELRRTSDATIYCGFNSYPMNFLLFSLANSPVTLVPAKQSKMVSPSFVVVVTYPQVATFKIRFLQDMLLLMSCWNVGNSESFPYFNRNSTGVKYPRDECGLSLLYIQSHALAYCLTCLRFSNRKLPSTSCRNV